MRIAVIFFLLYVMYCYNVRVTIKSNMQMVLKTSRSEVAACVSAFRAFAQRNSINSKTLRSFTYLYLTHFHILPFSFSLLCSLIRSLLPD